MLPREFNAATFFVDRNIEAGRGANTALLHEGRRLSYTEVQGGVNRAGQVLARLGVGMEERVLLLLADSPAFVFSFFGAIKIGAVPVPINTLLKPQDLAYILEDCRARVALVSAAFAPLLEELRPRLRHLRHVVVAGGEAALDFDALLAAESGVLAAAPTTSDDSAFWLYTSGTTGTPKAAVHLQHDMPVCCEGFGRHTLGITASDRCFSVAKLFFAYGLGNALYFPFWVGASSVLFPGRPEPATVVDLVRRERPTLFFAVPTAFAAILQLPESVGRTDFASVRMCLSAGEPLPRAIYDRWLERFGLEILDGIGTTEACHMFIANRPGRVRPGSSGEIVPGYEARIVDENGAAVPDGEVGHLLIKGDSICAGYWNQHERTRQVIQGEWIRTGDRYRRDPDGYYWCAGRSDDMIKAGGIWVSPVEVENALVAHEAVVEAGVVGAGDGDELVKPLAFVVLRAGVAPSDALEEELKEFVKASLAPWKYPRWIVFTDSLPRTATGKIQRFRLRERLADRARP